MNQSNENNAWHELGNEINKRMELHDAFGVHPILDLIRQTKRFVIIDKNNTNQTVDDDLEAMDKKFSEAAKKAIRNTAAANLIVVNNELKEALKELISSAECFLGAYYDPTSLAANYQLSLKAAIEKAKLFLSK